MRTLVIAGFLAASIAVAALGAEVKKKDGTVIAGEIVAEDADGVTLRHRLGEARIAKAEIASIDRGAAPTVEERLEKIKTETIERLKALAESATQEKRKEAAQALRDAADDVRRWNVRSLDAPRADEAPAAIAPAAPAEAPKPLDLVEVLKKWDRLRADPRTTTAARDQFVAEMQRRTAKVTSMKVVDVARNGATYVVRGTVSGVTVLASFDDAGDAAKVVKLKPGATISAVGTIRLEGSTELWACHLR